MGHRKTYLMGMAWACMGSGCILDLGEAATEAEIPPRVQRAFNDNCAVQDCHDSETRQADLSLEAGDSEAILDGSTPNSEFPLVARGDLYGSYLALKILAEGPDQDGIVGDPMPKGGGGDPEDMAIILGWIAGANLPTGEVPPPTFEEGVYPIIEARCSCHRDFGASPPAGLDLNEDVAYDNLVEVEHSNGELFIDPGSLRNSWVWTVVTASGGIPMPLGSDGLPGKELDVIRDWILGGACESDPDCME